jgi:cytochrome c biogenesis protein CcmG/thiol:disulfide interchange protein DsbE
VAQNLHKIVGFLLLVIFLLALIGFIRPSYRQGEPSVAGNRAGDFALTLSGRPAHLSDFKGKVVVLNFWASWCGSCVEELPSLGRLAQQVSTRGGIVLGVSIDEDRDAYESFLTEHPVVFPTYCSPSENRKLSVDYGSLMVPETYIIDRHGLIARKVVGPQEWDSQQMLSYFDVILAQK